MEFQSLGGRRCWFRSDGALFSLLLYSDAGRTCCDAWFLPWSLSWGPRCHTCYGWRDMAVFCSFPIQSNSGLEYEPSGRDYETC